MYSFQMFARNALDVSKILKHRILYKNKYNVSWFHSILIKMTNLSKYKYKYLTLYVGWNCGHRNIARLWRTLMSRKSIKISKSWHRSWVSTGTRHYYWSLLLSAGLTETYTFYDIIGFEKNKCKYVICNDKSLHSKKYA